MFTLTRSQVFTSEDIDQEVALFTFQKGRAPRRSFIEHRLTRQLGGFSVSYEDPEALDTVAIPFIFDDTEASEGIGPDDIDRLLNWSAAQPEAVQINVDIVLGFEEGDAAEALTALFAFLKKPEPKADRPKAVAKSSNTRALVTTLLTEKGSLTREEIIEALLPTVTALYQSRRPVAAIRQALRSLVADNRITLTDSRYSIAQ